jgi:hypothetical protein
VVIVIVLISLLSGSGGGGFEIPEAFGLRRGGQAV